MEKKEAKEEKAAKEGGNSKVCAILAYLLIGIIWYFVDEKMKKDSFAKFHVKQGIVLLIFAIAWSIALSILSAILMFGIAILWPLIMLLYYVPLVFTIIGIVNAVGNKEKELPIIGQYAKKLKF